MNIIRNFNLKQYNSLKINATADFFAEFTNLQDLKEVITQKDFKNLKKFVLGEGTNILLTGNFNGLVILPKNNEISKIKETDSIAYVRVGAGKKWHDFVTYAVENNLGGIENMALIPGSVGAAPVQNIAAYGQNFSDVFYSLEAISLKTGQVKTFTKQECEFKYRSSVFKTKSKDKYVVCTITVMLNKKPKLNLDYWSYKHNSIMDVLKKSTSVDRREYSLKDLYNAVVLLRTQKFPDISKIGCAGSFFKNPVVDRKTLVKITKKIPNIQYYPAKDLKYTKNIDPLKEEKKVKIALGQLLDEGLNLKGKWVGNVGTHAEHALLLVTNGNAKPNEVVSFAQDIKNKVFEEFGVVIETEVEYI